MSSKLLPHPDHRFRPRVARVNSQQPTHALVPASVFLLILVVTCSIPAATLAQIPSSSSCTTDNDCPTSSPTQYCVQGTCRPLAGTGEYCRAPSDCASFPILGALACTDTCGAASSCGPIESGSPARCCLGIPANSTCDAMRNLRRLNQCASGLQCLPVTATTGAVTTASSQIQALLYSLKGMAHTTRQGGSEETGASGEVVHRDGPSFSSLAPVAGLMPAMRIEGGRVDRERQDMPHQCGKQSSNRWLIGVLISVCGSVVLNLGLNTQKYAFRKNELLPEEERLPAHKLPLWVFGFAVWIVGNLANFVALSFAAQSLIASLGAVSLVSNAVAAPIINSEPFGLLDLISILFIASGTIVVVFFSNRDESTYSLCALMRFYTQPSVIAYLSVIFSVMVMLWFFMKIMEANQKRFSLSRRSSMVIGHQRRASVGTHPGSPVSPSISLGSVYSNTRQPKRRCCHFSRLLRHDFFNVRENSLALRIALPFSYASMGGALGGLTVMFAKSAAELISLTLQGENQFVFVPTYAILAGILLTGVGQVYYINAGLKRYDALLQVPCFYVVYTLSSIISGGVYFNEFSSFSSFQFVMFVVGVSLTFIGVACLTGRLKSQPDPPMIEPCEAIDSPVMSSSDIHHRHSHSHHHHGHHTHADAISSAILDPNSPAAISASETLKESHQHGRLTIVTSPAGTAGTSLTAAGVAGHQRQQSLGASQDIRKRTGGHSRNVSFGSRVMPVDLSLSTGTGAGRQTSESNVEVSPDVVISSSHTGAGGGARGVPGRVMSPRLMSPLADVPPLPQIGGTRGAGRAGQDDVGGSDQDELPGSVPSSPARSTLVAGASATGRSGARPASGASNRSRRSSASRNRRSEDPIVGLHK
ncbi:magnesium transporter NIPA-domain-containing protein [Catenaria anguillulae PL171]|uniref:Magnesium transporter NIPA-domain-containing protein n=1 Tax=Catenaria anguillulae PL171 TaxID=765915 RepID=A0A1Y2HZ60_9FUNG|nr:magnesium transporter NIPA-domain-containing protein [Catenaria anguillulae PL171]